MASNWQQTYEQLKKRKKQVDQVKNTSEINKIDTTIKNNANNFRVNNYSSNRTNIAPLTTMTGNISTPTTKKKEEKKWYQKVFTKGEFDDGYDFGDITKSILGTSTDIVGDVVTGVGKIVEAPIDILTNATASGVGLFSDKAADKIRDFADVSISDKVGNLAANTTPTGQIYNIITGNAKNNINPMGLKYDKDKSVLENVKDGVKKAWIEDVDTNDYEESSLSGYYADKVTELVGYGIGMIVGGSALTGATGTAAAGTTALGGSISGGNIGLTLAGKTLNIPTLALTGGMASGLEEANSKEDVTEAERWTKGISSGLIEGISEGLFGMFGVGGIKNQAGKEVFDYLGEKGAKAFSSRAGKVLATIGIKSIGEPIEEFVSYTGNYLVDNGIIDKMGEADFSQDWDWGEVGEQMALAYASSLIMQGGGQMVENNQAIAEAEKQLDRKLTAKEKATVTQAAIEGTLEEKIGNLQIQVEEQERKENDEDPVIDDTQSDIQSDTQILEEAATNETIPPTVEQELTNITNQIDELETMLDTNLNATQQQEILSHIKALEEQYNTIVEQLGQTEQNLPVYKVASSEQVSEQVAPIQQANVEQVKQPTTQETNSNSLVEADSNTLKSVKSPVMSGKSPVMSGQQTGQQNGQQITNEDIAPTTQVREPVNNTLTEDLQEKSTKEEQLRIINESNPAPDSVHTWVRSTDDIKTFDEAFFEDGEYSGMDPDFTEEMANESRRTGKIKVYSSYPIENGVFVSPSQMEASQYAGGDASELYSKEVNINDVAWIDGAEGQYAKTTKDNKKSTKRKTPTQEELDNLENIRKNKSGSEYASAYYDLEKKYGTGLFKGLNNYKSTGQALAEEIAPVKEELADLKDELKDTIKSTKKELKELTKELKEVKESVSDVAEEFKALSEVDIPMIEQQASENLRTITEDMAPVVEDTTPEYEFENNNEGNESVVESPLIAEGRDMANVGSRKVKAYQYENPEVRPYFQEAAGGMLFDLNNSTKGERIIIGDISQTGGGDFKYSGVKRETTPDIAELLDVYNYTYAEIEKGLNAIIEDHGAENIAVAKRIEFALDERLRKGYTAVDGFKIPPNQEYIKLLEEKGWADYYNSIPIEETTPIEEQYLAIEPMDDFDNGGPMIRVSPELQKPTTKNVDWDSLEDTSKGSQQRLKVKQLGETLESKNTEWEALEDTSKGKQKQYNLETGELEDSIEKKTKKEIKEKLLKDTGIMNVSLDDANKIPKLLMENTDPIRLQEMIFGRSLGTDINNMFFHKVKDNTSEKIRFQNKEREEIKKLGIKPRSKESAAVQKYGEKQWANELGEVVPYEDKELAAEFPDVETQNKIKKAADIIRKKYDSYLDTTNKVLTSLGYNPIPKRNDYMRHFQELNDIFSRVGIPYNYNEMTANDLPTDINGLTADFSPSKNFFASALERKGVKTTYDAITGIDGYLEGIGNLIYHTEDIQRLRAYEQYIRDTYGENHGFDNLENLSDEERAERIEKIQDNHLSNYASWLHEYTNTLAGKKSIVDRGVEHFLGRKIYSFLNTTKTQVGRNMIGFNIGSAMTNAIAGVQTLAKTNKLAAVKGLSDTVKNVFVNDGFAEKNNFLTSRFGSDRLSKNLWQKIGDAGFIFMQGTDNFVSNFVVRSKYNELKAKGYTDEQAHTEAGKYASRLMSDRSQGAAPNIYNSQMLGIVTQFQNEVNNQLYSMFYDTYHESREAAGGNALKTAAGMTFVLGQMAAFTHVFGKAFESMAGYNPTFDIVGMLMKAFGFDDDEDSEDTTMDNVAQAFKQLVDALPYVNIITGGGRIPISEAFTGVSDTFKALTGGKDEYGQDVEWSDAWKSLKESAPYFILPSGYSQIKKTTQGLGMYDEDLPIAGSYTDSGNLRFTADESTWGKVQAGIFGRWANDEAQAYVDSDFKTINKSNIEEMLDLDMISSEYRDLKSKINKSGKKVEDKVDYIAGLDELTDYQKNILVNNILDRDYDVDVSNYEDYGSYEEFNFYYKNQEKYDWLQSKGISYDEYAASDESKELYNYAYKYPETYEVGKAITGDFATYKEHADYIWDLKADKDEEGKSISGTKKAKVISYVNNLDLSIPQKAMLIRKTYSSFDEYNNEIVDYVSSLDADYDTKKMILEDLDMTVEEDGTVTWK